MLIINISIKKESTEELKIQVWTDLPNVSIKITNPPNNLEKSKGFLISVDLKLKRKKINCERGINEILFSFEIPCTP